ncbi:MAG: ATP synthase F1 subunit delta [Clostridia bacterium]|nr:ATP synthase F1 subunit delta [Clostridia bacterium]MBQ9130361.1 ATP synthase F1 subunit delta [Clostridia bacterium]
MDKLTIEYGGGLFELADEEGLGEKLLSEVLMLQSVFSENPGYIRLMTSPVVTKEEKAQLLKDSFEGKVHPYLYNFICLMADRGYFSSIPGCFDRYQECYRTKNGIIQAKITSAALLSDEQKCAIVSAVERKTGKTVEPRFVVDASLLAGLRVEAGGELFENSAKSKLEEIRRLLESSVTGDNT